ncbi:MAG TPA: ferrous iron transport protein B, partial [Chloroflexia bacterium]|nr:ferrous iron transport protein B [Chloroflexia bacterium]
LVILAGQPNVGKSVLFKRLTGRYATVSNYPGTTVEVTRGTAALAGRRLTVVDAPGINSLQPLTPDEGVTRSLLLRRDAEAVVQVADAKNLSRALFLTLQFAELGIPIVLDLNMMDEAHRRGVSVDADRLASLLGVDVITTVATSGHGIDALAEGLSTARVPTLRATYSSDIESAAAAIETLLPPDLPGKRWHALALLAGDPALERDLALSPARVEAVERVRENAQAGQRRSLSQTITQQRWASIAEVAAEVYASARRPRTSFAERAGWWAVHPLWGWPILAGVLFVVYKLVGELGAGTLVDFFEGTVFGQWVNPAVTGLLTWLGTPALLLDFLAGEYGLLTVGLTYGIGIVLPIVSIFFLVFGVLEDSGYLPRLAVMLNRTFARIGLNGKAVLPMVLGLGCVTMATMTTRVLGTRKERVMATLLLALSVPCSAQLGVVLAMAGGLSAAAVLTWGGVVLGVMLLVGWLAGRLVPGDASDFVMELPPLRPPRLDNLLVKTLARVEWYLKEVIPLFLIATAALFVLARTGILDGIESAMSPLVVGWLGLPPEASGVLLLGFLRRDYGATGLFDMSRNGLLSPDQVLVSLVVVTLFVPCVATVIMMAKEHGARTAAAIVAFVFPFAFLVGGLVRLIAGGL